jgi:rod shape-determining protein MreD
VRVLVAAAVLTPVALLQVTLAPRLEVFGAFPNLLVVAVAGWTLLRGAGAGMRWAIAGGLFLDLVSPGPLGLHALALLVAAYAAGFVQRRFEPDPVLLPALTGAVAGVAYNIAAIAVLAALGTPVLIGGVVAHWVVPSAAYDALLMPPAALALARLAVRVPPPAQPVAW